MKTGHYTASTTDNFMKDAKAAIILTCLLLSLLIGGFDHEAAVSQAQSTLSSFVDQTPHTSGFGSDAARIDSQITLKIPEEQADAVYNYVKGKYAPGQMIVMEQFPAVRLLGQEMSDVSVFTDEYFDTPNLDLYKTQNSARFRSRINTTHPEDRKSGRQLIQLKVTPPGRFDMRNEIKYNVKRSAVGQYRDPQLPFVQLVSKGKRSDLTELFAKAGIDAHALQHILTITQTRSRVYINWEQNNIVSFSVDKGEARILWATGRFASVDIGLVEKTYTAADESARKTMWQIRDAMIDDLRKKFPDLTTNSDSKYGIVLGKIIEQIGYVPILRKLGFV